MTAARLLHELAAAGLSVCAADDGLRVRGPQGALTPDLRARVVAQRDALLALLRAPQRPPEPSLPPPADDPAYRAWVAALDPAVISRNQPGVAYPCAPWETRHGR